MADFVLEIDSSIRAGGPMPEYWRDVQSALKNRSATTIKVLHEDRFRIAAASRASGSMREAEQPARYPSLGLVVVFDGRLDDASALCRRYSPRNRQNANRDVDLVAAAYSAVGEAVLEQINGEYSVVIIDELKRKVIAGRDLFGTRTLYWSSSGGRLWISNEIPVLRRFPQIDRTLDAYGIFDFLVHGSVDCFDKSKTPFRDIIALEPGGGLFFEDDRLHIKRVRRFSSILTEMRSPAAKDVPHQFNEVFCTAVEERVRDGRVLISLSGGLDSTTIAAHASRLVSARCLGATLRAVTSISNEQDPEWRYASQVSERFKIPHFSHMVRDEHFLVNQSPTVYPTLQLHFGEASADWRSACEGVDLILDGHSGDSVLYPDHLSLRDVVANYGLPAASFALLYAMKSRSGLSLGTGLSKGASNGFVSPLMGRMPTNLPSWLSDDFLNSSELLERWRNSFSWMPPDELHPTRPKAQFWLQWANWQKRVETVSLSIGPPVSSDPYLDFRVVSFCFSICPNPWMNRKLLLRRAGAGILPDSVIQRPKTTAGAYFLPFLRRIEKDINNWEILPELEPFVNRSKVPIFDSNSSEPNLSALRPFLLQRWCLGLPRW